MKFTDLMAGQKRAGLAVTPGLLCAARNRVAKFHSDERGAMVVFALICLIGMLAGAGMAVDFMRFENTRTRMQATLDRSLLAAASLNQTLDAEDVVVDYFAKSGLTNYELTVNVDEGLNYRTVTATVSSTVDSIFLNMVGIDSMTALSDATAEERIQNVEISIVLDISGSMAWYSRLYNMKSAAKDFVETLLSASDPGQVSISIVPYNANVNVGSRLIEEYNVSSEHSSSNCVRFDDEDFASAALTPDQSLERLAHFDLSTNNSTSPIGDPWCQTSDSLGILALSISETDLDDRIDDLVADGNTAADIGMKWGVALLDPSSQPVVASMVTSGDIAAGLSDRPAAYTEADTMKVIILMTDGENTSQYDIKQSRKSGASNIWVDSSASASSTQKYSVYDAGYDQYYYPHNSTWNDEPIGASASTETVCGWERWGWRWYWSCTEVSIGSSGTSTAVQLSYPELWALFSTRYVASYFYDWNSSNYYDYYYSYETIVDGDSSDDRLLDVCSAARSAGITVFTIGFEAPSHGEDVMEACASSSAHYYDVDGLEIGDAFSAIAATIQKLKLVQ